MAQASFNTAAAPSHKLDALDLQLLAEADSALPNLFTIKNLLKAGADIDARNDKNHTPLIVAAGKRNVSALELLAQSGADLYASTADGVSAMFYCLGYNNLDMVKKLLDNGYDPERETLKGGLTALMWAANLGKLDLAEEIAKRGGNVYRKHAVTGETALDYASKKPHIVKALKDIAERTAAEKLQQQRDAEARAAQAVAEVEKEKLNVICNAGLPTAKSVKRLKPVSFKKPH